MTDPKHVQAIQDGFRSRITNPESAILTKEGVYAEINHDEAGLNAAEGSFGGVHPKTWKEEYLLYAPHITIQDPKEFENLPPEEVVQLITDFKDWYFQKPPKQDFFALPSLLWLVCCDAAFPAPVPVISRIQQLIGDPKPDGIWGSGTTERVQQFFAGKTVPDMVKFAQKFTNLIIERYNELEKYPQHADNAQGWRNRAEKRMAQLLDFVNAQNAKADAGAQVKEETSEVNMVTADEILQHRSIAKDLDIKHITQVIEQHTENTQRLIEAVSLQSGVIDSLKTEIHGINEAVIQMKSAIIQFTDEIKIMLETALSQTPETPESREVKQSDPHESLNESAESLVP